MPYQLFVILIVLFTVGCSSAPVADDYELVLKRDILFVVNHGWHTGIIIDAKRAQEYVQAIPPVFRTSRFIEIGWGDEMFYRAPDISWILAVRALFWPTDSVLHIAGISYDPRIYYRHSELEEIPVTEVEFVKILQFIDESFERDNQGNVIKLADGNRFYRARGQYHLLNTCNSWVINALSSGGITALALPTLTASGAMFEIRNSIRLKPQTPDSR